MNKNHAPETFVVYNCLEVIPYYKKDNGNKRRQKKCWQTPRTTGENLTEPADATMSSFFYVSNVLL